MWINLTDDELKLVNLGLSKCQDHLIAGAEELAAKIEEQQQVAPSDALYISAAREHWASDDLEIDDDPRVSAGGDPGAWVHAWVWVRDDEAGVPDPDDEDKCRDCGEEYADGGDGYNGRCPDCADKAEEEGRSDD
ncbi:hypothetical protein [Rhizobium phage RHph_X66]|nr:hypothetical protein [Rhizobium phage RHph_X66]